MPETVTSTAGQFVWTELNTQDVSRAKDFYSKLIGWKIERQDVGDMSLDFINTRDGETIGHLFDNTQPGYEDLATAWVPYVQVDDIDATCGRVAELGGKVKSGPVDIPGDMGRVAVIEDPTGASLGLWQKS